MTSAIPYAAIDETYPVAGVDNNSQGFRDNFSYIKTGLSTAASEITALQQHTAKTNTDIATISSAEFDIDITNGDCQTFTVNANTVVKLNTWPLTNRYAKARLIFKNGTTSFKTLNFQVDPGTIGRSVFKQSPFPSLPLQLAVSSSNTHYIIDVWSQDAGKTIYMSYLGEFVYTS